VDGWLERRRLASGRQPLAWTRRLQSLEPYARAVLRIIVGFLLVQHGARKAFGLLTVIVGGRRGVPPLAIDALPALTGYVDLVAGSLLMLGLFVRQTALVVAIELLVAYVFVAAPRGPWPIRNGGGEALLEAAILAWFVTCGAGAWSLDRARARRQSTPVTDPIA
jgi:putative oxidoreductase